MKQIFKILSLFSMSFFVHSQDTIVAYFNHDSYHLGTINKAVLANQINKKANLIINEIIGYSSIPGTNDYNKNLSEKRIHSTLSFLKQRLNIDTLNIHKEAFGEVSKASNHESLDRKVLLIISHNGEVKDLKESMKKLKIGESLKLENLNFEPGLDILLSTSIPTLNDLLEILTLNEKIKIQIEGHICCNEIDDQNLSLARSKRVYDYLVSHGIEKNRLNYKGFGASKPIFPLPELHEAQRIANRRVEIKLLSK